MFKKILIVEDIDSISLGLVSLLKKNISEENIQSTKYCDEAVLKIKKAIIDNEHFDLMITDLSFKQDHRDTKLHSGEELIKVVKKLQPNIKIIAYSIEDRTYKIKSLFNDLDINGYICKGRESSRELVEAIEAIYNTNKKYISAQLPNVLKENKILEIEAQDIELMKYLSKGMSQQEIGAIFKTNGRKSSSCSSIEKKINRLKLYFKAKNTIHLVSIVKDMGLI